MPTGVRSKSHASGTEFAGKRALFGWVMFDWASQPFYTLVVTFLFAPYFVNGFMADPVLGASLWGYATGLAELIAALLAPVFGAVADTVGRKCICNALMANIGLGQVRGRAVETGLVTSGDDLASLTRFMTCGRTTYSAADVIAQILGTA